MAAPLPEIMDSSVILLFFLSLIKSSLSICHYRKGKAVTN